jgi:predicted dehydrogenase
MGLIGARRSRVFETPMDAVVISSPSPADEAPCMTAFARGLHVLCEATLQHRRILPADRGRSEDNAMALLRNPDGVTAIYQATWTEWKGYRISLEAEAVRRSPSTHSSVSLPALGRMPAVGGAET